MCVFEGQEMFISEQVLLKKRDTRPSYDENLGGDTLRTERKGRQVEVMPRRILTEGQQRLKLYLVIGKEMLASDSGPGHVK
jgi:hypothetical protein